MANIYSNMTQAQKDNERKYLSNLQKSGNEGEKAWASSQMKQLDSVSTPSTSTPSASQTNTKKNTTPKSSGSSYKATGTHNDSSIDDSNDYNAIKAYGNAYAYAQANNDEAGMKAAHDGAEAIRAKYGYSGGTDGSEYIGTSIPTVSNTQTQEDDDFDLKSYIRDSYSELNRQIEEQNRLAVEQGVNRLNAQKRNINQSADDNARQAYIQHMQSLKALPQQLASQGVSGGATETANLGLATTYQNNVNAINQNKANSLQDIDNAIADLQTTGDLATAEQVLANNQAALNAYQQAFAQQQQYNQWAQEFNAYRADTAWNQNMEEKAYQDKIAQQQWNNDYNMLVFDNENRKEEFNRVMDMAKQGIGNIGYISALAGVPESQVEEYLNLNKQFNQANLSNIYSQINNRGQEKEKEDIYKSTDSSMAAYINNQLGGELLIYDDKTKKFKLNDSVANKNGEIIPVTWYKDPIIQQIVLGIYEGNITPDEGYAFLNELGFGNDIERVMLYTKDKNGNPIYKAD